MNMQDFYKQLFTAKTPTAHQRSLASLTRINRTQILDATQDLTWLLWGNAETVSAPQ